MYTEVTCCIIDLKWDHVCCATMEEANPPSIFNSFHIPITNAHSDFYVI